MKYFVKSLDKNRDAFPYLQILPSITEAKLKERIFGIQIRKLMKDPQLQNLNLVNEKAAWKSFKTVVVEFLGNKKSANYKELLLMY